MITGLKKIGPISWESIWENWKAHEGSQPSWQAIAREKGFDSWESWRGKQADFFNASTRAWEEFEIADPMGVIPQFRMGPYKSWQDHFAEKNVHTFADLVREKHEWVANNSGVQRMLQEFPGDTLILGLYLESSGAIVVFEGHHRCAAVALAAHDGLSLNIEHPRIAISRMAADEERKIGEWFEKQTLK